MLAAIMRVPASMEYLTSFLVAANSATAPGVLVFLLLLSYNSTYKVHIANNQWPRQLLHNQ